MVNALGYGGQIFAEKVLGWSRVTIRKAQKELALGGKCEDDFSSCGRPSAEDYLPTLLSDIGEIVEPSTQTDPTFRSTRIYTPLTAKEVHKRLHSSKGYRLCELPSVRTISNKLNQLGFNPQKVAKCKPLRKIEQTDAIFEEVQEQRQKAQLEPNTLHISMDSKATVKIGAFSRGGKSRQSVQALDHDFESEETLTPFGILLPDSGKNYIWFSTSKVTADFMADRLEELWMEFKKDHPNIDCLLINADNGSESNGQRTQWLKRLVDFTNKHNVTIRLVYYPPYHSKYNPVERTWGVLENHWRGQLLESVEKTIGLARSMSFRSVKPTVRLIRKTYSKGIRLGKKAMGKIEAQINRKAGLEKWSIQIRPKANLG